MNFTELEEALREKVAIASLSLCHPLHVCMLQVCLVEKEESTDLERKAVDAL